ncbi:MAG: hypothetical protein LUH22_10895 [Bacteroides sp.]|nr:hypothetical protein [Bacteroides sp.]
MSLVKLSQGNYTIKLTSLKIIFVHSKSLTNSYYYIQTKFIGNYNPPYGSNHKAIGNCLKNTQFIVIFLK